MNNWPACLDANLGIRLVANPGDDHERSPLAYDSRYLALADWLRAELWTANIRLARAVEAELPSLCVMDLFRQPREEL